MIEEIARWISDWGGCRTARHRRREFLAFGVLYRGLGRACTICLHRCLVCLTCQFRLEILQHLGGKCARLVPDLNHTLQLLFLLGWDAFECVVEEGWHQLRHSLDRRCVCAWLAAAFDVEILTLLFRLLDPSPDDTIDHVDGAELVGCGCFLQCAIQGLHDGALCLQREGKLVGLRKKGPMCCQCA